MPVEPMKPVLAYIQLKSLGRWYVSKDQVFYRVTKGPKISFYVKPRKGLAVKIGFINCDLKVHRKDKWLLMYFDRLRIHGLELSADNGGYRPDRVKIQGGEMAELLKKEGFIEEGKENG